MPKTRRACDLPRVRAVSYNTQASCGCSSVVEHRLPKPSVAGSSPVTRSRVHIEGAVSALSSCVEAFPATMDRPRAGLVAAEASVLQVAPFVSACSHPSGHPFTSLPDW